MLCARPRRFMCTYCNNGKKWKPGDIVECQSSVVNSRVLCEFTILTLQLSQCFNHCQKFLDIRQLFINIMLIVHSNTLSYNIGIHFLTFINYLVIKHYVPFSFFFIPSEALITILLNSRFWNSKLIASLQEIY